ncbi:DUF1080 domain-containing protein [Paenibacillus sp. GD4]|uniref:family 16 glycoside hydrolase n=1 Tax=Paenibacillus sp. GD4 TaxID=3068890 RepID=UPI00279689E7|nr:family 16 glycoside hydrolase [Paenibacillus sp. GD4]MDQ1911432.1 DUF1080 domain-containing protein [Paenibacillus sp. GD4]
MNKARASLLIGMSLVIAGSFLPAPKEASAARTINCSTASCLSSALSTALAGDTIVLSAGTYSGNFVLNKDGSSGAPIVITSADSSNRAILNGGTTSSGYVFHNTGNYVQLKDLKLTNGKKGIMWDNANNGLIDNVEVYNIGEEGVHFRDGSSYNTIQGSTIRDCGVLTPDYGEGIYVGSDYGKWSTYVKETDYNVIRNNTIGPNVAAESIDIKEGSKGTLVEGNTFNGTGISGANSADSFMDVKGNDNIIRNNIGYRNNNANINDAFQTNERQPGWGFNNDFYKNTVYMDSGTGYVVNVKAGSAKACSNTRSPSGNMYLGTVTTYTGCSSTSLLSDSFESYGSFPAGGWTNATGNGTWSIVTDGTKTAKQSSSTASTYLATNGGTSWTNYDYSLKLKAASSTTRAGLAFRVTDNNNYYWTYLYDGKLYLQKKVAGTNTVLASTAVTYNANTWYTLRVVASGTSLKVYLGGTELLSVTDSAHSAGKIGLWNQGVVVYDDVSVVQ